MSPDIKELLRIDSDYTSFHVVATPEGTKPGITIFMAAQPGAENSLSPLLRLLQGKGILPYAIPNKRVPGESPDAPERVRGTVIKIFGSDLKHDATRQSVVAAVETLMGKMASIDIGEGRMPFKELGDANAVTTVKGVIDDYYRGLDGGKGVREPKSPAPTTPGPAHAAKVPEPKTTWAEPKPPASSVTEAVLQAADTPPPPRAIT